MQYVVASFVSSRLALLEEQLSVLIEALNHFQERYWRLWEKSSEKEKYDKERIKYFEIGSFVVVKFFFYLELRQRSAQDLDFKTDCPAV